MKKETSFEIDLSQVHDSLDEDSGSEDLVEINGNSDEDIGQQKVIHEVCVS